MHTLTLSKQLIDQQSLDPSPYDGPFREPSDPQLLNKFLDCVNLATSFTQQLSVVNSEIDTQSFVTATSQMQSPNHQEVSSRLVFLLFTLFLSDDQYLNILLLSSYSSLTGILIQDGNLRKLPSLWTINLVLY
jgi:hypothetical protein